MKQFFPIFSWIKDYNSDLFKSDLAAGLTVGVMLIPQGMAYAMLAGLPPIYGLYAATVPLIVYGVLGTSRQLSVGPGAMVAILIASGVGSLAAVGSPEYIGLALLLALMIGVIQLLMGVLRMGFMVNFLSHPVISGFTSAVAIIIAVNQLKHLLGISLSRGMFHEVIAETLNRIQEINIATLIIGLIGIFILILIKKKWPRIPGPLLVVGLSIMTVWSLGLMDQGVQIVGEIPSGLPSFDIPPFNPSAMLSLLPIALTIAFIGFMQSIAVAKAIQKKHKDYTIVANQELIALGMANILGSLFKAFPVTGGLSRSAVNDQSGAKSGIASIISATLIIITLLFFTSYFYFLPNAILAAIIMVAIYGLIDFKEARNLWKTDKTDFYLFASTALATLFIGIEEGIFTGVVLSIIMVVYRSSFPHIAELGQIPNSSQYRNVNRFDNLIDQDGILILRIDAQIYFANLSYIRDTVYIKLNENKSIKHLIIDASAISGIDSSAIHMLRELHEDLSKKDICIHFVDVKGPVRDIMKKNDLLTEKGPFSFALTIDDAVSCINKRTNKINEPYVFESKN